MEILVYRNHGFQGIAGQVGILDDSQALYKMLFPMSELQSIQARKWKAVEFATVQREGDFIINHDSPSVTTISHDSTMIGIYEIVCQ